MQIQVVFSIRKGRPPEAWLRSVLLHFAKQLRLPKESEVSVLLVGEDRMRTLHGKYSGEYTITDVLSFPGDEVYGSVSWPHTGKRHHLLGEMVLCVPQIRRQARANAVPIKKEFATMLAHSLLHLLGHDHKNPKDAQKMYALQEKLVYTTIYS